MAPPVMTKLWKVTGEREYLTRNDEYFKECYELLYNKDEHLFARDLRYVLKPDGTGRKEANGQPIFWSRGNGWVMGGLVRVLQDLPADYPERPFYEKLYNEMANRVLELQQEDGLWRASLLDPESYPGSSKLALDRKSTRLNSSHVRISYAVFCLKKKKKTKKTHTHKH